MASPGKQILFEVPSYAMLSIEHLCLDAFLVLPFPGCSSKREKFRKSLDKALVGLDFGQSLSSTSSSTGQTFKFSLMGCFLEIEFVVLLCHQTNRYRFSDAKNSSGHVCNTSCLIRGTP